MFTLLQHYWRPDDPMEVTAALAQDWVDALEAFPREAIDHARRSYIQSQPSRRPTPADIRNRAASYMAANRPTPAALPPPPEPKREVVSEETRLRILEQAGFTSQRFDLVKRFPKAPTPEALEAAKEAPAYVPVQPSPEELEAARAANPLVQASREFQRGQA